MRIGGAKQLVAQPIHRIEVRSSGELQPQPRQDLCQGGPMYKHAYQVLTALMFLAWLVVPATHAQSIMLKADIPFDFVVGEKQLPSGEYHVKSLSQAVTEIRSNDA